MANFLSRWFGYDIQDVDLSKQETPVHDLKCWPEAFNGLWEGRKLFEIRRNDRDFHVGDTLKLREYLVVRETYSGRIIRATVTWMTPGGQWGLPKDICVMSLKILSLEKQEPSE